jgi:hypothetical protein
MLQHIENTIPTWSSTTYTEEDQCLRKSMVESLKSILAHIQCDDNVSLSDGENNEDSCVSDHKVLSEDDPGKSDFDHDKMVYFLMDHTPVKWKPIKKPYQIKKKPPSKVQGDKVTR